MDAAAPAAAPLRLSHAGLPSAPELHLSVDGVRPHGPNLSHWPGNRTPPRWKADLSTGICLAFARAPASEQTAFLAGAEVVLNDHYDTDGFLSLLAILRPDVAIAHEEVCLAAAATGDFQVFTTARAFAIDRIVAHLADPARSPLAFQLTARREPERSFARYSWLLEHAAAVLTEPERWAPLYERELAVVQQELVAARQGMLQRRLYHHVGLAVLHSAGPLHPITRNTLAGAYRVLHVEAAAGGPIYRYSDRTESWFETVTLAAPPRRDLRALQRRLQALEEARAGGQGGADGAQWCADPPEHPLAELWHGVPAPPSFDAGPRTALPSRLTPGEVERAVVEFFAGEGSA